MTRSVAQEANILAHFLPQGRVFASKFVEGSNTRRTLIGFAKSLVIVNALVSRVASEFFPDTTTELLGEWEALVGIPNGFFNGQGDLATRRVHVLALLRAQGVQTEQDFIDLAALLGVTITIEHGGVSDLQLLPLDVPFLPAVNFLNVNFIWRCVVQGEPVPQFLEDFFNTLKQADSLIEFSSNP
jgi:uncharacterized protein YmfQ (DUF2313 family)